MKYLDPLHNNYKCLINEGNKIGLKCDTWINALSYIPPLDMKIRIND